MNIIICTSQVPFVRGGAELLVDGLRDALRRHGHTVDVVALPYRWQPHTALYDSMLAWRLIDLNEVDGRPVDLVIATKFPSYLVQHRRKVVWLVHQHRQAYDWYGTTFSDFVNTPADRSLREALMAADITAMREAHACYAISQNVARRLWQFNRVNATPLYPPSHYDGRFTAGPYGDYIFSDARLDAAKRLDLLIESAALMHVPGRIVLASTGPARAQLEALVAQHGLQARITFCGYVDDATLLSYYANARAVYYAPFDEDYGFTTIQAMAAARPVITTSDAGGTLEFVRHGHNGLICAPHPPAIAHALDTRLSEAAYAASLGTHGPASVAQITWDDVVRTLTQ
ncbi:MAG: glycosyltransferase family 4 protein [Roseiflexaceae bacterium]